MSFNRKISIDVKNTIDTMKNGERNAIDGKNWLGHHVGSGAAKIDSMLINGATLDEMSSIRGAVEGHLYHLEKEHGLKIHSIEGKYFLSV